MAMNPNSVISDLRMMSNQQLQQYAAMHKNDPFIFPLAFQESQTRQRMESAKQAQMAGQQQPKVVDQDLAQMAPPQPAPQQMVAAPQGALPEDSGIGQLPAQNLQKMAGGGIVAFEEGGSVPRYANTGLVQTAPSAGTEYGIPGLATGQPFSKQAGQPELTWVQRKRQEIVEKMDKGIPVSPQERMMVSLFGSGAPTAATAGNVTPTNATQAPTYDAATQDKGAQLLAGMRDTTAATPPTADKGGIDKLLADKQNTTAAPQVGGTGSFEKAVDKYAPKESSETSAEYMARRDKEIGAAPTTKQEERLNKQEEAAKGDKDNALNMALIKAGLGMMAGKSQYALQNIGEGAQGGLSDYNESMKDLKKAAIERDKARDALENAAYAYKRGDFDAYEKLTEKSKDRTAQYNSHVASALGTIEASKIHAAGQASAANAPRNLMEALGSAKENDPLLKGFNMQTLKAHASSLQSDWAKHAYPNGTMGEPNAAFLKRYPTPDLYISENIGAMNAATSNNGFVQIPDNKVPNNTPVLQRKN
jgi:hypothetical protein